MLVKLDENLPATLTELFAEFGHDADSSPSEGLGGFDDDRLWNATQVANRFLVTQDLDFSDARKFVPGTHAGILILRLNHPSRQAIAERLRQVLTSENFDAWAGCVVVATRNKVRVRNR